MTIDDLESKLEGGAETQTFEVKGPCTCDIKSLAKDILAMSNVQGGGNIAIGIEDDSFVRHGVTALQKATYKIDEMKDQMAPYADPHVNFRLESLIDDENKEYIIITVLPFEEIPVICRKDGHDIKAGTIYHRNRSGRVQSARVSNSYDMRDIITNAAVKMMHRLNQAGLHVGEIPNVAVITKKKLDDELKGL